jgi:hypothetical protein
MGNNGNNHRDMWVFPTMGTVTDDLVRQTFTMPRYFRIGATVAGILFLVGIIGFIARAVDDGFGSHGPWGYYMAIFSFVFMITGSAPLVAVVLRFTKNHWRRPLSRISELFAVVGILNVLMFIPLMVVLPGINNPSLAEGELEIRRTIWFEVPIGAPYFWDIMGIVGLSLLGLAILWLSATPDMAEARVKSVGYRRRVYGWLAGHWYGTKRQWEIQKAGLAVLGGFYFMFLVYMHFVISTEFGMSLVPGWKDSILPPLYSVTSFQASLGLILVVLFVLRRWGGYSEYIGVSPFWSASKILLGLTLLWAYHLFAFFMTFWYGRLDIEQTIIKYFFVESYSVVFLANLLFSFVIPFVFILLWNPLRKTDWGPSLAGLSAVVGAFMFNIRMFVGSFNAADLRHLYDEALESVPAAVFPDVWDVFMVLGGLGGAVLVYMMATRLVPLVSIWETKEGTLYQHMGTLIKGKYLVIAKPE